MLIEPLQDDGAPPEYDLPPPSKAGAIARSDTTASKSSKAVNGKAPEDEEWGRMGWAPRFGMPKLPDDEGNMLDHQTWLEGRIDDKFFGGMARFHETVCGRTS